MQREASNPIRTTEWEDIQYQFGNRVGKYETHEAEILLQKAAQNELNRGLEAYNPEKEKRSERDARQEDAPDAQPGPAPVVDSDDDDDYLTVLRQKRMAEMKKKMQEDCFGVLRAVPGSDYVKEVTEASAHHWVVAVLGQPGHSDCEALLTAMRTVAQKCKGVKFVSMLYSEALDASFPTSHLPCVLLYHQKKLQKQLTGPEHWKERRDISVRQIERVLRQYGAIPVVDASEESGDEA
eukprot:gene4343-3157_t